MGAMASQSESWASELPPTATFEAVTSPSADDFARAAKLAYVTRHTWGSEGNLGGICFDSYSGGPEIVILEEGALRVVANPQNSAWVDTLEMTGLPTAYLASKDYEPAVIVSETWLEMVSGDAIVFPYGSGCGKYGAAVFLTILLLPGSIVPSSNHPTLGMEAEALDINFGIESFNESVPPAIVVGRLHLEPGSSLALENLAMPLALALETGSATIHAKHDSGLLRNEAMAEYEPSIALASEEDVNLAAGQLVYIPATAQGSITALEPVTFMMVGIDFVAARNSPSA